MGSLNGGALGGFRNWIINGNFTVNQRSGTRTPGNGVYGFDRWKGHAQGLEQVVESLPAGEYTLSWFGGGTGTFGGTTAPSPITATVAEGNTSVVVPSTASLVQLEPGPVATPFEHRPVGTELTLCQRYFVRYSSPLTGYRIGAGYMDSTTNGPITLSLPTALRDKPTVSFADLQVAAAVQVSPVTSIDPNIASNSVLLSTTITTPTITAGVATQYRFTSASAYIAFDAEL